MGPSPLRLGPVRGNPVGRAERGLPPVELRRERPLPLPRSRSSRWKALTRVRTLSESTATAYPNVTLPIWGCSLTV